MPQGKKFEAEYSMSQPMVQSSDMQTVKQPECKKSYKVKNQAQSYTSRPKRPLSSQLSLIYKVLCDYFNNILDIYCVNWSAHKWLSTRGKNTKS